MKRTGLSLLAVPLLAAAAWATAPAAAGQATVRLYADGPTPRYGQPGAEPRSLWTMSGPSLQTIASQLAARPMADSLRRVPDGADRPFRAPQAAGTPFYGVEIANYATDNLYALYEYTLDGQATLLHPLDASTVPDPYQGAYIVDGKYCYQGFKSTVQSVQLYYVEIDLASGETTVTTLSQQQQLVYAQAYNPADGRIYGIGFDGTDLQFGIIHPETRMMDYIAPIATEGTPRYLSFTASGLCYAIVPRSDGASTVLCFDTATGACTEASHIQDLPFYYNTGAAIDPATGLYAYHAFPSAGVCAFYTIDPATGVLTQTAPYPSFGYAEIEGFAYLPPEPLPYDPALVPDSVTDLRVTTLHEAEGLALTVAYATPSRTADGATALRDLLGSDVVTARISVAGMGIADTLYERDAIADGAVCHTLPGRYPSGQYDVCVALFGLDEYGPTATVSDWLGVDLPGAPLNPFLHGDADAQTFTFAWDAPVGQHGKEYDASKLTYTVRRYENGVPAVVAEGLTGYSFRDTLHLDFYTVITYSVTSVSDGVECATAMAQRTFSVGGLLPPVVFDFATKEQFDSFKSEDVNGFKTWTYDAASRAAMFFSRSSSNTNVWLHSPAISVEAGMFYFIELDDWCAGETMPERMEVRAGYERSAAGMTDVLVAPHVVTALAADREHHKVLYQATRTGSLYIGLHALSDDYMGRLYVSDLSVSEPIKGGVPQPVRNAAIAPDAGGALRCTLTFDLPALNLLDEPLASVGIRVAKDSTVVYEAAGLVPGAHTELVLDAVHDMNTYSIVPYTEAGEGDFVLLTSYAGFELPVAADTVTFAATAGGHRIEWSPIEAGIYGGAVGDVTYTLVRSLSGATDTIRGLTQTSYDWAATYEDQALLQFGVLAENSEGRGAVSWSATDVVGTPYALPFVEHFVDAAMGKLGFQNPFWGETANTTFRNAGGWVFTSGDSDGDGYCLYFSNMYGYYYAGGALLYSGMIDVAGVEKLFFKYDVLMSPEAGDRDRLTLFVSTDRGRSWSEPLSVVQGTDFAEAAFRTFEVDLSAYGGGAPIMLGFYAYDACNGPIALDNVRLEGFNDYDIAMATLTAPATVEAPASFSVLATLSNKGLQPVASGITVDLYNGTELLRTQPLEGYIGAGAKAIVRFDLEATAKGPDEYRFRAVVHYDADATATDNESDVVTTRIIKPYLPAVADLAAAPIDGEADRALLTWSVPDTTGTPIRVVDSFEAYKPFGLDGFGLWSVVDGDGQPTRPTIDQGYPNEGAPQSWMVYNISDYGRYFGDVFSPYRPPARTGKQSLIAVCPADPGVAADDWLISPELSGQEQTVSFYVSQFSPLDPSNESYFGNETYEVYYSTSGRALTDFQRIDDERLVTVVVYEFENVTIELPEGTRYFAIRHTSQGVWAMFIDDVTMTYLKPLCLDLIGYNVYRDGELLTEAPIAETSFAVALTDEEADFTVETVYNKGESALSNVVVLSRGIIGGIETLGPDARRGVAYDLYGRRVERILPGQPVVVDGRIILRR